MTVLRTFRPQIRQCADFRSVPLPTNEVLTKTFSMMCHASGWHQAKSDQRFNVPLAHCTYTLTHGLAGMFNRGY